MESKSKSSLESEAVGDGHDRDGNAKVSLLLIQERNGIDARSPEIFTMRMWKDDIARASWKIISLACVWAYPSADAKKMQNK